MDTSEEVVISGISGKFPGCDNFQEFADNLMDKRDLVSEENCPWPKGACDVPCAVGKIEGVNKFDDTFFGVYSRLAAAIDPLTRILIERAYEAVMDAGVNPKALRGSNTGVYTASCVSDSESIGCDERLTTNFWLLAHVRSLMANRISNVLNLQGPSWNADSSWIGGVECLKHAVNDIKSGRIGAALVGVSNVILFPEMSRHWLGLGKLSPDGSCKPFDENACGYGRSEGVVMLLLQRASDAKRVYGTVVKAETAFCGAKTDTFLKPSEAALTEFLTDFYSDVGVPPEQVVFLEADGSGVKDLDEVELKSIWNVFCKPSAARNDKFLVGSVKGNAGHAEGAACFLSLAKALICAHTGFIPPNVHFEIPNRKLQPLFQDIRIPTEKMPFPDGGGYVAVNCLGVCASAGHILLKQHAKKKNEETMMKDHLPRLTLLSARHEKGLFDLFSMIERLPFDPEYCALVNDVFAEEVAGHFYRGFVILQSESVKKMTRYSLEYDGCKKRPIWFVFAGIGSQWPGMGADMMRLPAFAAAIRECHDILSPMGVDLTNVVCNFDPTALTDMVNIFVGIAAVQIALVDVLRMLGVTPHGMLGHSLGENGCAYADGCFDKRQTILAAYYRGKASHEISSKRGLMAAIGLHYTELTNLPAGVQIACHNSATNCTISGPEQDVAAYAKMLEERGIFVRFVNSNHVAYHSKCIEPLADYIYYNISKLIPAPKKRSPRWISTSVKECDWQEEEASYCSARYHVNNFKGVVYFEEACSKIPEGAVVVEISPHGLFQSILKRSLPASCYCLSLAKRETENSLNFLLEGIGKLHSVGVQVNVNAIYPPIEYPLQSGGTPGLAQLATWNHETNWKINKYVDRCGAKPLEISLRAKKWRFLTAHRIGQQIPVPCPILLMETTRRMPDLSKEGNLMVFSNVRVENFITVTAQECTLVNALVQAGSGNFEISSRNRLLLAGCVVFEFSQFSTLETIMDESDFGANSVKNNNNLFFTKEEIYKIFGTCGAEFAPPFANIDKIRFLDEGYLAEIAWHGDLCTFVTDLFNVKSFVEICRKGLRHFPVVTSFLKLSLDWNHLQTLEKGSIVKLWLDKCSGVIRGPGLEITGLALSVKDDFNLKDDCVLESAILVPYVSYEGYEVECREEFLTWCGEIALDTMTSGSELNVFLSYVNGVTRDDNLLQCLQQCWTKIGISMKVWRELPRGKTISGNLLIITGNNWNWAALEKDRTFLKGGDIFIMTFGERADAGIKESQFSLLTRRQFHTGQCLTLFRKMVVSEEETIQINPNEATWMERFKGNLLHSDRILVRWFENSVGRACCIADRIKLTRPSVRFRFLIIMGENAETSSFFKKGGGDAVYEEQLSKGLTFNIFKNGNWYGLKRILIIDEEMETETDLSNRIPNISGVDIRYARIPNFSEGKADMCVEFSGYSSMDKSRIMGICYVESNVRRAIPAFSLLVPTSMTLKDAAELPLAYIKAYYGLKVKTNMTEGSKVLIYGADNVLGQAVLNVLIEFERRREDIYVCLENPNNRRFLLEKYPSIKILDCTESVNVAIKRMTKGRGVDIVVNTGTKGSWRDTLDSLSIFGRFLQLGECCVTGDVGLRAFLKGIAFHSVTAKEAANLKGKIRKDVEEMAEEGLKKRWSFGDARPCSSGNVVKITRENNGKFLLDRNNKCYVLCGERNEAWHAVLSWLLDAGATKFVFYNENEEGRKCYEYLEKLTNLRLETSGNISIVSASNANDDIWEHIDDWASIDVVFTCSPIQNPLTLCLRKKCRLFVGIGEPSEKMDGGKVSNIVWNGDFIRGHLHSALRAALQGTFSDLILRKELKVENISKNPNLTNGEMKSTALNANRNSTVERKARFKKVYGACPDYDPSSQIYPIFLIPAAGLETLRPLIRKLIYPVFCADITDDEDAENVLKSLAESLRKIQANGGPYTILSDGWAGAVALALADKLAKSTNKRDIQVILLEGLPRDVRKVFNQKGWEWKLPSIFSSLETPRGPFSPSISVIAVKCRDDAVLDTYINFEEMYNDNLNLEVLNVSAFEELISREETKNIINDNVLFHW